MTSTLCQFVGDDGPAHAPLRLSGPPKEIVVTSLTMPPLSAIETPITVPLDMPREHWRLKTSMLKGDTYLALYQRDI